MYVFKFLLLSVFFVFSIIFLQQVQADEPLSKEIVKNALNIIDNPNHRQALERNIKLGNISTAEELNSILSEMGYDSNTAKDIKDRADRFDHYAEAYEYADLLAGAELAEHLRDSFSEHVCLEYRPAKSYMYRVIDNYESQVEGVYTGQLYSAPQDKNYNPQTAIQEKRGFMNCEHTWPQSFFDKLEPMRSDIWHLYPTDSTANGTRSSYPFGEVEDCVKWEMNGSALGLSSDGRTVFEPRDCHKGNVARSMLYFSTIYDSPIDEAQENIFRKWHIFDPVDEREKERADRIEEVQHNRNPFIDHPEYVSKIEDF